MGEVNNSKTGAVVLRFLRFPRCSLGGLVDRSAIYAANFETMNCSVFALKTAAKRQRTSGRRLPADRHVRGAPEPDPRTNATAVKRLCVHVVVEDIPGRILLALFAA